MSAPANHGSIRAFAILESMDASSSSTCLPGRDDIELLVLGGSLRMSSRILLLFFISSTS